MDNYATKAEIERAMQSKKNDKATGPDKVPIEYLKSINNGKNMILLVKLFNHVYDNSQYPQSWLKFAFIPLPKKIMRSTAVNAD